MYQYATSSTDSQNSGSTDDLGISGLNLTRFSNSNQRKFPPPPRLCKSENNSSYTSCLSDSSVSDGRLLKNRKRNKRKSRKMLPPVGIFWDIENCQVPRYKCASNLVHRIREIFMVNYREAEFVVVCDVKKENAQVIQDLHDTQVNLIHVQSTSKNAADEKLRQSLRRFAEVYPPPSAVILISSDINFAADLCDLRYRRKIHVILIHNANVTDALISCANETFSFNDITESVPVNTLKKQNLAGHSTDLLISNLPQNCDKAKIKNRLQYLTSNCGGKVKDVVPEKGVATIRFSTADSARRAQRRIHGEDVYGNKIKVFNSARESPIRNYAGRRVKNPESHQQFDVYSVSNQGLTVQDAAPSNLYAIGNLGESSWKSVSDETYAEAANSVNNSGKGMVVSVSEKLHDYNWAPRRSSFGEKRARTPQNTFANSACALPGLGFGERQGGAEFNDNSKNFYSLSGVSNNTTSCSPVELFISNLDSSIDVKELRKMLMNMIKKYAMIISLNINFQSDGYPAASVKVTSQQEAQYIISQLHRQKLGSKRIMISYMHNNVPIRNLNQLRAMIIAILQEVPGNSMPLFKLVELLETRYHCSVSISEVNKLKDVCTITDDSGGRSISLTPEVRCSPPSNFEKALAPYCTVHCPNGFETRGWGESDNISLPNIVMPLKLFSSKVNELLTAHMGTMPLLSFQVCYEIQFGEPLLVNESGVPLEHLLTCVANVQLKYGGPSKNVKYIKREIKAGEFDEESVLKNMPPSLIPNINLLCREVVDLLKTMDRCQLLWSRFIPAYHHHFGRQCRVADYGYTKLLDLFESIPHVVQLMGDPNRRIITLSHSAQMRRFTSDLLRVLKGQAAKQLFVHEFSAVYERMLNKPFNPVEYGLCSLEDLLDEVPENTVVINKASNVVTIAIPKREQTAEEIVRTKQFAAEVVELLRHTPQCSMLFNKFIPAYHHHFSYQCRVSDYGFTRLIELFESISDVVKIEELVDGDRKVSLTIPYAIKVLGTQLANLIKNSKLSSLPLEALSATYLREYGYPLKPQAYECSSLVELLNKLHDVVQITDSCAGALVVLVNAEAEFALTIKVWAVLNKSPYWKSTASFMYEYQMKYNSCISLSNLGKMNKVVLVSKQNNDVCLSLTPVYILLSELYKIVYESGGQMLYKNLSHMYKQTFAKELDVSNFNMVSAYDLINQFGWLFVLKGNKKKLRISLNKKLAEFMVPLPRSFSSTTPEITGSNEELLQWPPPPAHDLLINRGRHITPPKPDTPPAPGTALWNNWNTPTKMESDVSLSIALPTAQTPRLLLNPDTLISPTRSLLSAYTHPLETGIPVITAPDANQLPLPDKLLAKGTSSDDSNDSGVINNSKEFTF